MQKEKEVLQLRTELDRLKAQNPGDGREVVCIVSPSTVNITNMLHQDERAKRERDRIKWNTLMEEITKHKTKVRYFFLSCVHILPLSIEWRIRKLPQYQTERDNLFETGSRIRLYKVFYKRRGS